MRIHRIDHVGVIVDDLPAAKAFFLDFGLEVLGEGDLESELIDRVVSSGQVRYPALLQYEISGLATLFFGFFMSQISVGGSVLFTYWISKDE